MGAVESSVELPASFGPLPTDVPPSSFVAPSFVLATALSGEPCGGDPVSPFVAKSGEFVDPHALAKAAMLLNAMSAMTPPELIKDRGAPSLGIMRAILMFLFSRAPMTARPLIPVSLRESLPDFPATLRQLIFMLSGSSEVCPFVARRP
jgi:hypothetical protein